MARAPLSTESSKVYVGMLVVTALAMTVGIFVMVLEGGEYDWAQKAPDTPALNLPKAVAAPPSGTSALPAEVPPVVVVEAPKPIAPPAVVPAAVVEAPKPAPLPDVAAKPAEPTPSGPIPSPLIFPGR